MQNVQDMLSIVTQILFITFLLMAFTGMDQKLRMIIWARGIRMGLDKLEEMTRESKEELEKTLRNLGAKNVEEIVEKIMDYFTISPVDIEPTDITKRLGHILRSAEYRWRELIDRALPNISKHEKWNILVMMEITNVLNTIYKIIRHYLYYALKNNNIFIIMQLWMIMPEIMKMAEGYRKAVDAFKDGKPIGDSVGPAVAQRFFMMAKRKWRPAEDTVAGEVEIEGRRVYVIKAEGPGATVGNPGEAVERVVEELGGNVDLIITVDAALKLEGEETGSIAEGSGAAIGDPGPEKIRIERAATKYGIPLHAIVIKMSNEEAILEMKKEIAKAIDKVFDMLKKRILELPKGATAIIVGIGNTSGVGQ